VVKLLRVVGVSAGTTTSGRLLLVEGCGVGVAVVDGMVFAGGAVFGGGVVLVVGVDLAGGVTVIAGVAMPIVRLVAHNMATTLGLMLLGFMVSTYPAL
jgi:hypothetical protein